ncbi:hypothetical protein AMTR_s00046p00166080, partial [Amborella trichopoda]
VPTYPTTVSHSLMLGRSPASVPFSPLHSHVDEGVIHLSDPQSSALESSLQNSLVGRFNPRRHDLRGIKKWSQNLWSEPQLICRSLSNGAILFSFPCLDSALRALQWANPTFKGVVLSLSLDGVET